VCIFGEFAAYGIKGPAENNTVVLLSPMTVTKRSLRSLTAHPCGLPIAVTHETLCKVLQILSVYHSGSHGKAHSMKKPMLKGNWKLLERT
jgi:hypothetical protein